MKSTACDVHQSVQRTENLDGLPELPAMPTSIKDQMPDLAGLLQQLGANMGREFVQVMVKAATDLRVAYDKDDYRAVRAVYARKAGWIDCQEGLYQLGVPEAHMAAFAKRHRQGGKR